MDEEIEKDENLDDSVVAEEAAAEIIKKLREKLKATQKERDEYLALVSFWKSRTLEKAEAAVALQRLREAIPDLVTAP